MKELHLALKSLKMHEKVNINTRINKFYILNQKVIQRIHYNYIPIKPNCDNINQEN